MENKIRNFLIFLFAALLSVVSCESQQQSFSSPPGYDFSKPKKYRLSGMLKEISGIAFYKGRADTIYTEEDENGKVFHFKLGNSVIHSTKFWKKGDFEDITICNDYVIMLRSDGVLFTFPFDETKRTEAGHVKVFEGLLPTGEYEGLASTDDAGKIYVLCKHCSEDKTRKWGGGYIFQLNSFGTLSPMGNFEINIKEIDRFAEEGKINFHPSALVHNPKMHEWFILSSVNKMLVITDETWKVIGVYPLNPSLFPQPEGIEIDAGQNLYISNERNQAASATILFFSFEHK